MERIILIETSTALCSVALAEDGAVTAYRESSAPKAHASLTAVFIQELLSERELTLADCDAVCVSMGPGSYTGLRVGVSTAKGLCFGSGKPLLAVGTLDTLVAQAASDAVAGEGDESPAYRFIIPMVDARRMEVYTAVFENGRQITETAPAIIDENSFAEYLEQGPCLFIGDGAGKCADVIKHPDATFLQCWPKASSMVEPALAAYRSGDFKDVAYFEPFYLKEFVATVSKKKMW
jgi:tRNA threonylcarbamoyladenosine biosynthesis protein TsaB